MISLGKSVGIFVDFVKKLLVLEIEEDGGFLDFACTEDAFDDLFTGEGLAGFFENIGDDISYGSLGVAPRAESIDAASDEDKTRILDEFVVDGLDSDVLAAKFGFGNSLGNIREMHRFFFGFENDEDFVTNVARIDGRPLGETPESVERGEELGDRSDCADVIRVFVI